jgi:hypothetical protein
MQQLEYIEEVTIRCNDNVITGVATISHLVVVDDEGNVIARGTSKMADLAPEKIKAVAKALGLKYTLTNSQPTPTPQPTPPAPTVAEQPTPQPTPPPTPSRQPKP